MKAVFEYMDYKSFLRSRVGEKAARRGLKTALAHALGCHTTYISQVLNEHAHLSAEQATGLNEFLGHTKDESHFFLLLLHKDRAGNMKLRQYYQEQIQEVLDRRLNFTRRLGGSNHLSELNQAVFYSSWHHAAVHVALTVPELQTKEALVKYFVLPMKRVVAVLEFLTSVGLAEQKGDRFVAGATLLRIGGDSPNIHRHHANWRAQALESLEREQVSDLHYSAVVSLSAADVRALKNQMLENIKSHVATIRESKEEEIYALCMDFFSVRRAT